MCLGEYGVVVEIGGDGRGRVRFSDGSVRDVSLAVTTVEGVVLAVGDQVMVSMGMVLHVEQVEQEVAP